MPELRSYAIFIETGKAPRLLEITSDVAERISTVFFQAPDKEKLASTLTLAIGKYAQRTKTANIAFGELIRIKVSTSIKFNGTPDELVTLSAKGHNLEHVKIKIAPDVYCYVYSNKGMANLEIVN